MRKERERRRGGEGRRRGKMRGGGRKERWDRLSTMGG